MDPHDDEFQEFQQEVLPPIFDTDHANKLQEFEWSVVKNNISVPKKDLPTWAKAYS
jgi:hypothetical protein